MMGILKKMFLILTLFCALTVGAIGCGGDEGAMEEAGEQVEETMDEAGDKAEDATE